MQIYGYPGDRVNFVSGSGAAGSIEFGDPASLVEEFFGPPHTASADTYTYFNGSIALKFTDGKVTDIVLTPAASREKMDVFVEKERLTSRAPSEIEQAVSRPGVSVVFTEKDAGETTGEGATRLGATGVAQQVLSTITFAALT